MGADARRVALDLFCEKELDVEELASRHPQCGCENAPSPKGSPGPVQHEEKVRLFLVSTSDIKGEKQAQREKRFFKAQSLKRAFTTGLSVVRLPHASVEELEYSASLLYDFQSKRNPEYGGLLLVVDFPVFAVRMNIDGLGAMCVFETPSERQEDGSFKRPSHADIANSASGLAEEDKLAKRQIIYNRIVEHGMQRRVEDVDEGNLVPFLPKIVKDEGSAR